MDTRGNDVCYSKPSRFESEGLQRPAPNTREIEAISAEGCWSACDVWIAAPAEWTAQANPDETLVEVQLTIYAQLRMGGRQRVRVIPLSSVLLTPTADNQFAGIVARVRGFVCDGFAVTMQISQGAGLLTATTHTARMVLMCWGEEATSEPRCFLGGTQRVRTPLADVALVAGVKKQVSAKAIAIHRVTISSLFSNPVGSIVRVGDINVAVPGAGPPGQGQELAPGGSITIETDNLSDVYAIATANCSISVEIE